MSTKIHIGDVVRTRNSSRLRRGKVVEVQGLTLRIEWWRPAGDSWVRDGLRERVPFLLVEHSDEVLP